MLYINGKFLAQRTTGVQRFSRGLLLALDQLLARRRTHDEVVLLCPPGVAYLDGLVHIKQRNCGRAGRSLTWWEQVDLPLAARDGTLLCFSGSAPLLARRCIPTIHDAAVFLHPEAYSWKFVAWYRFLFRWMSNRVPYVLTVSNSSANDLRKFLSKPEYKVIPNAAEHIGLVDADDGVLGKLGILPRRYVLAVGSLNPTKNFASLVEAYLASGLGPDIPLVIAGDLNRTVFSSTLAPSDGEAIVWAGPVDDAQLKALYENALVFVFPSLYEGFGIPPLEAMSCGCPVIASNASSIPEVCADAALYFPPLDTAALARLLREIRDNAALRQQMIVKGKRRSSAFSWAHSGELLKRFLDDERMLAGES